MTGIFFEKNWTQLAFLAAGTTDTKFCRSTGVTTANSTNRYQKYKLVESGDQLTCTLILLLMVLVKKSKDSCHPGALLRQHARQRASGSGVARTPCFLPAACRANKPIQQKITFVHLYMVHARLTRRYYKQAEPKDSKSSKLLSGIEILLIYLCFLSFLSFCLFAFRQSVNSSFTNSARVCKELPVKLRRQT